MWEQKSSKITRRNNNKEFVRRTSSWNAVSAFQLNELKANVSKQTCTNKFNSVTLQHFLLYFVQAQRLVCCDL